MSRSHKLLLFGVPVVIVVLAVVGSLVFRDEYITEQSVQRTFVIDEDFTKIRKIMVRTNATKEIVTMGGDGELVEQQWRDGSAAVAGDDLGEALLRNALTTDPDWRLELSGTLKVRPNDEYVGQEIVELNQQVLIVPDRIESEVEMTQGTERLHGYAMTTRLWREAEHTQVELTLTQQIETDPPWFAHGIADRRVRESAERSLARQEAALRRLIEENDDKAGLFPLR